VFSDNAVPIEASYVESFLVLNALGGECLDDFDRVREDHGRRATHLASAIRCSAGGGLLDPTSITGALQISADTLSN
jgi:hypothetical protein